MSINPKSDLQLSCEKEALNLWISTATPEEIESGEVVDWKNSLELVNAEIKHRHEQGKETR
jgi:hypothetical protein